jgi:hypothetical protein
MPRALLCLLLAGSLNALAQDAVLEGFWNPSPAPDACYTPAHEAAVSSRLAAAAAERTGDSLRPLDVRFSHPLAWAPGAEGLFHAGIRTAHTDHNPLAGTLDYACGARAYNGHTGTDYMPFPFPWHAMDRDLAHVVAAAPGIIVLKEDGHPDRHCDAPDSTWNAVYVRHKDGSVAWYGHLKRGSLTTRAVGDTVDRGAYLGVVGSSGKSTGPHLHFEVRDASGKRVDPFLGGCNDASRSLWLEQPPYRRTRLVAIGLHDALPDWGACTLGDPEAAAWRDGFFRGERAWLGVYLQDPNGSTSIDVRVLDANGTPVLLERHEFSGSADAGYALFDLDLPHSESFGTWTVEVALAGEVHTRTFTHCYNDALCACPTPQASPALTLGHDAFGLYWSAVDDAVVYRVQRGRADPERSGVLDGAQERLTVGAANLDWTGLEDGAYRWRVRAACGELGSPWGPWQDLEVTGRGPGPVPEDDVLWLSREAAAWRVYDLAGRLRWSGSGRPEPGRVTLPAGLYRLEGGSSPEGQWLRW